MKLGSDSKQAIESLALDKGVAVESCLLYTSPSPRDDR